MKSNDGYSIISFLQDITNFVIFKNNSEILDFNFFFIFAMS